MFVDQMHVVHGLLEGKVDVGPLRLILVIQLGNKSLCGVNSVGV